MKEVIVFTDLDGTLLDSKYSFKAAMPALRLLRKKKIPLVICTSKTRAEIEVYRKKLGNKHPFISENGGAIFIPRGYFEFKFKAKRLGKYEVIELGLSYDKLVRVLKKIKKQVELIGFLNMSVRELVKDSGLNLKEARLARLREYDEAFKFRKKDKSKIIKLIKKTGLNYTFGGRYMHILGNNNKGKAVKILMKMYKKKYGKLKSLGLGDSKNDLPMLRVVNKPFLIKGPANWNKKVLGELR